MAVGSAAEHPGDVPAAVVAWATVMKIFVEASEGPLVAR